MAKKTAQPRPESLPAEAPGLPASATTGPLLTGFTDLDELVGGFSAGELVVVAGRPASGKSVLGMNLLLHAAVVQRRPALVASTDARRDDYAARLLCCHAGVDSHRCRRGTCTDDEEARLRESEPLLSAAPLHLDDAPRQTAARIAGRLAGVEVAALVLVDSILGMEPGRRFDTRHEEAGQIVRELKALAREAAVPVVVLAGLNRASEDRQGQRPRLSDMGQTGVLEEAADVVILMHRPDLHEPGQHDGIVELIVAKRRGGPTGEVVLAFVKQHGRLADFKVGTPFDG